MNLYTYNYENGKKYTAKSMRKVKNNLSDTSQYNLTKEEVAESIIHSLNDAQKFLRGELKLGKARDLVERIKREIAEEELNEKY